MRVCFITGEYPPMRGGVGDYTREIARALVALGVEVGVITSHRAASNAEPSQGDPRVFPIIERWGYGSWRAIGRTLAEFQPDVVHIQYQTAAYGMHPAINTLPIYLKRFRRQPAVAVTFHDLFVPYLFPKAGPVRRLPAAILTWASDAIIVTNEDDAPIVIKDTKAPGSSQTPLRSRHGNHPVHLIPIGSNVPASPPAGFDRDRWRQRMGVGKDHTLLAYFGFLGHAKGTDTLFEAFRDLLKRGNGYKLVMVGGSAGDSDLSNKEFERRIRAIADEPMLRPHIIWTGFTNAPDVSANLHAADFCVLPFRQGASLRHGTLVAAIVNGMPIVTTHHPIGSPSSRRYLPDELHLSHRDNAYLVEPDNPTALVAALQELTTNPTLANRIRSGIRDMAPLFAWESIARQSLDAYNGLR